MFFTNYPSMLASHCGVDFILKSVKPVLKCVTLPIVSQIVQAFTVNDHFWIVLCRDLRDQVRCNTSDSDPRVPGRWALIVNARRQINFVYFDVIVPLETRWEVMINHPEVDSDRMLFPDSFSTVRGKSEKLAIAWILFTRKVKTPRVFQETHDLRFLENELMGKQN